MSKLKEERTEESQASVASVEHEPGKAGRGRVRDWRTRAKQSKTDTARGGLVASFLRFQNSAKSSTPEEPDERPAPSWANRRVPAPIPFEAIDCLVEGPAPQPSQRSTLRTPKGGRLVDPTLATRLQRRQNYWDAFKGATGDAQERHRAVAPDVALFHNIANDPEIKALGFRIEPGGPDLVSQALAQKVPERSDLKIGSLFSGVKLDLSKSDRRAISSIGGRADMQFDKTVDARNDVDRALHETGAAALAVHGATLRESAALHAIEHNIAANEANDAREVIERRRAAIGSLVATVNVIGATMTGVLQATAGSLPDTFEQIGIVAAGVISTITDPRLESATARLERAQKTMRLTKDKQLRDEHAASQMAIKESMKRLDAAKKMLRLAIGARRNAFAVAGREAAREARGPKRSKDKIAAIIAAIPRVEVVVARAKAIARRAVSPAPTEFARRGLGMATHHNIDRVGAFLRVCGELNNTRLHFGLIASEWQTRLDALNRVKTQIEGRRPGGNG